MKKVLALALALILVLGLFAGCGAKEANPIAGEGRFIHTYAQDINPLPSFEGEPKWIEMGDEDIDTFTNMVWENLNEDNKVSLFVRYIDIETGKYETRIVNKNK